jgi:carboxymethylenebutenolidase
VIFAYHFLLSPSISLSRANFTSGLRTKQGRKHHYNLEAIFDQHDVGATMKTIVSQRYVYHVPVSTGSVGYGVYNFYKNYFVGKMPDDTKLELISRTVGQDQVVDELILKFTHDNAHGLNMEQV